ncbi:uncharacterized protein LOC100897785 [Galendromus occidentalis]|uniref:Uncharacterized protein LOC100897785 n=1 Tax=Galendromus occidentalis TaxID=34638 RepID=A0AAJ6VZA6_9ACAR|nr:uncharacterized protein LOC100897785 [Galendromus occidentalis]
MERTALTPLSVRELELNRGDFSNLINLQRMSLEPQGLSPEEEILRLRGRRSFEVHAPINIARYTLSPTKKVKSPAKALQFRSPRKRPQTDDASPSKASGSPSKPAKRCRLLTKLKDETDPTTALRSLNKDQLLSLLSRAMTDEEVRAQVSSQIPVPDLQRMEGKLQQRLKIVLSCTGGKQQLSPSVSYKKMHPSLDAFKLKVTSHTESLLRGEQWSAGLEYVLLAWPYVRQLPEWRDNIQNRTRLQCFKILAGLLATCLPLCTNLTDAHKEVLARRLNAMKPDCPQVILPLVGSLQHST